RPGRTSPGRDVNRIYHRPARNRNGMADHRDLPMDHMKAHTLGLGFALVLAAACTGTPTGGGDPSATPTGSILVATPNGDEAGIYLVNVVTGRTTRIDVGAVPFTVSWQGGYSPHRNVVYGT